MIVQKAYIFFHNNSSYPWVILYHLLSKYHPSTTEMFDNNSKGTFCPTNDDNYNFLRFLDSGVFKFS